MFRENIDRIYEGDTFCTCVLKNGSFCTKKPDSNDIWCCSMHKCLVNYGNCEANDEANPECGSDRCLAICDARPRLFFPNENENFGSTYIDLYTRNVYNADFEFLGHLVLDSEWYLI